MPQPEQPHTVLLVHCHYRLPGGEDAVFAAERALLEQMLLSAESLTLSMTCPALDAGEDIFLYQKKFLLRMRAYAGAHALMCEEPLILTEDKRHQSPDLAGLQRAFTRPETVPPAAGESLRLIEAPTVYEEMRFAAAEISRLVREEGLRYRDCVILCRDLDRYRNAKTVLEEYDLPYFCGEKQNILFAPLPFFLLTALEAASGSLKTAAILRLARSAASGLSPQQAGALENYSFIWNISGEDWLRPFTGNPEGMSDAAPEDYAAALAQVEGARRRVIEPLAALRQSLRNAAGPDFAAAVYRYAEAAGALKNLTQNSPLPQREAVDRQWNSLVDVLDLMTDFYPERALNAREWSELFRLALSRIDLGEVPNTVDHVILAESDRVRLQSPRAVVVLGVNVPGQRVHAVARADADGRRAPDAEHFDGLDHLLHGAQLDLFFLVGQQRLVDDVQPLRGLVIADVLNVGHLPDRFIHSLPSSHIQNAVLFPGLVPQDSLIRIA